MIYDYLIHKNDVKQSARIEEGKYDPSQLVEMKVPLLTPYYSSSMMYEQYYGEISLDGNFYSYVKRKVQNDTVYILCLANNDKSEIKKTIIEHLASLSGAEPGSPLKKAVEKSVRKQAASADYFQLEDCVDLQIVLTACGSIKRIYTSPLYYFFPERQIRPPKTGSTCNNPDLWAHQVFTGIGTTKDCVFTG